MGMKRAYKEIVLDNLPDHMKKNEGRPGKLTKHPRSFQEWIRGIFEQFKWDLNFMGYRNFVISNNALSSAYAEADRNRKNLEICSERVIAEARADNKIKEAVSRVMASEASPEAKLAAITALMD